MWDVDLRHGIVRQKNDNARPLRLNSTSEFQCRHRTAMTTRVYRLNKIRHGLVRECFHREVIAYGRWIGTFK